MDRGEFVKGLRKGLRWVKPIRSPETWRVRRVEKEATVPFFVCVKAPRNRPAASKEGEKRMAIVLLQRGKAKHKGTNEVSAAGLVGKHAGRQAGRQADRQKRTVKGQEKGVSGFCSMVKGQSGPAVGAG